MDDIEATKLTKENWDEVTKIKYNLKFLNDRNAVREVLYKLLQIDNEIKCSNLELQNLKKTFDSQLCFLQEEIQRAESDEILEEDDRNELLADLVKRLDETNARFSAEVESYHLVKEQKCHSISENVDKLFQCKSQFKFTHQNQVESLRRFRMFCDRPIRPAVDIRLKSVDRKFCDELFYMDSCEQNLKHIFALIDDKSSHDICRSTSSTALASETCSDFFRDFAWMRNEQLTKRMELFNYFKECLSKDLVSALANMHISRPDEPIKFIANYLKHLKQNNFRMAREEKIFSAAQYGENLFPDIK